MGVLKTTIITLGICYLIFCAFLFLFQRSFLYFPTTERPKFANHGQAAKGYEVITTQTQDGLTLEGWYHPPIDVSQPTILWFQGNSQDHSNRVYWAQNYVKYGYGVLLAGYRGYGGNLGSPSEENLLMDGHSWVKTVQDELGVNESQFVLYGESLGTGVAIEMANHYKINALILHTPYKSLRALAERQYPIIPISMLMKDQFDSAARIKDIKAPVLMVHGTQDELIPFQHAKKLFELAPKPKDFVALEGAMHSNIYDYGAAGHVQSFLLRLKNNASQ